VQSKVHDQICTIAISHHDLFGILTLDATEFGIRIRQARERLGMSQLDFASLVSKDQRAISEYENGKRKLFATDVPNFARILNVPVTYFYDGEIQIDDLDSSILYEIQQLPNVEAKQAAMQIIRIFAQHCV
jgi:transcriptional regulator with XRE-family HTH domain